MKRQDARGIPNNPASESLVKTTLVPSTLVLNFAKDRRNVYPIWIWLPDMDLNHDKQIQSLLCYRYTIGQAGAVAN